MRLIFRKRNGGASLPLWQRLKRMSLAIACLALLAGGGFAWYDRHTLLAHAITLSADAGLRLERIELIGRLNTDKESLMAVAGLRWHQPMLTLNLTDIHQNLSTIGWLKGVRIERHLPDTLIITLIERQALALLQDNLGHRVIDLDGEVIGHIRPEDFTHLPVIKGEGAAENAQKILTLLKTEPELFAQVWSLTYQAQRRWDVFLRNNIRVQLPEIDAGLAWAELAEIDALHSLTARNIVNIDLRAPNKLVIRPTRTRTKGDNT